MKKLILSLTLVLCVLFSFGQLDITKRKVTLDSIAARVDSIYIKSPVAFKDHSVFDSTANFKTNIGIGIATPLGALHIDKGVGDLATGIRFESSGKTAIYPILTDRLAFAINNNPIFQFRATQFEGQSSGSPSLINENATATNPNILPDKGDVDNGIGANDLDQLSFIAGAKEIARASENVTEQFIINPQGDLTGTETAPSLAFGDGNTGFYESSDNVLNFAMNGLTSVVYSATEMKGATSPRFYIRTTQGNSYVVPYYTARENTGSGLGFGDGNSASLIANSIEVMRLTEDSVYVDSIFVANSGYKFGDGTIQTTAAISGGSINLGTDNQIPFMNSSGTDFEYSGNYKWDGNTLSIYSSNSAYSTIVGLNAGINTTGNNNTFLGYQAGYDNISGYDNTFIGMRAGLNSTGNNNAFLGKQAGTTNTSGAQNTFIGAQAGYYNSSGTNNLFLGYTAGYNETGSNKLYIDISSTGAPLIWGDFANDSVRVNGDLDINGNITADNLLLECGLFCRHASYDIPTADVWETVKMDTIHTDLTTDGFKFNNDSTGIVTKFAGYITFSGHAAIKYNGAAASDETVYVRLMKNSTEVSCFNTAVTRNFKPGGGTDLISHFSGIAISIDDTISVQSRVTNNNIDLELINGGIFDDAVPFSIFLKQFRLKK